MKTVLVPLDGSKNAMRALEYAIAEVRGRGCAVHLLNVELPLDDYGMVPAYLKTRTHREITAARARRILGPAIERLRKARIPHAPHVVWDGPAEAIARTARRLRCDAIVMGTRGMGAAGNLLLGSCATKVIHLVRMPVTLVK